MLNHRVVLTLLMTCAAQALADHPTPTIVSINKAEAVSRIVVRAPGDGQWKVKKKDTGGFYSLSEGSREPGEGAPPHTHSVEDEGFYILEGQLTFYVENNEGVVASPGSFVFAPKGLRHSFRNEGTTKARFLVIISPGGFEKFFDEREALQKSMDRSSPEFLKKLKALEDEYGMQFHRAP